MAQENPVPEEGKKKGGNNFLLMIIIVVVVTLVVSAGTSFLIITLLGQNVQKTADAAASTGTTGTTGLVVQADMIREGSRYPVMLKCGKDVAIVDALYYKVGSEECRSSICTNKLEILSSTFAKLSDYSATQQMTYWGNNSMDLEEMVIPTWRH